MTTVPAGSASTPSTRDGASQRRADLVLDVAGVDPTDVRRVSGSSVPAGMRDFAERGRRDRLRCRGRDGVAVSSTGAVARPPVRWRSGASIGGCALAASRRRAGAIVCGPRDLGARDRRLHARPVSTIDLLGLTSTSRPSTVTPSFF